MLQNEQPTRTWREIAALASQEYDSKKLGQLIRELEKALEERDEQASER